MAIINGTRLALTDTFVDDATTDLITPKEVTTLEINGTTYVYVAAGTSDAIQIFTLSGDGALTPVGSILDTGGTTLNSAYGIEAFSVNGTDFVLASGLTDNGITLYTASDNAPFLTFADRKLQTDDANFNLNDTYSFETVQTNGKTFVYVPGFGSNGISVFEVTSAGALVSIANYDDDATLELDAALHVTHFNRSGTDYILASGFDDDGVSVFQVNASTGTLTEIDSFEDPVTLDGPWGAKTVVVEDIAYMFVPAYNGDRITVLAFDGTNISQIQSIYSDSLLNRSTSVEIVGDGDNLKLAVFVELSDAIQYFDIETNSLSGAVGTLTHAQTLSDGINGALNGARHGATVSVDGAPFLLATALFDSAVNVYAVGGGDDVLEGTGQSDAINGYGGDDFLYGFEGDDSLDGGDGIDMIFGGSGADSVLASAGNDVSNGGSGYDTFDARYFDGAATGITIDLEIDRFVLPDGTKTVISNFERIYGIDQNDRLSGNAANNDLRGGSGEDTIKGRDGNDVLRGQNDADKISGGNGNDRILGGWGDDYNLSGESGNDTIEGEGGDDSIYGGNNDDSLSGGADDDRVDGGKGNDTADGGSGVDRVFGGNGNDSLMGGADNDFIFGDSGNDTLNGGTQNDAVTGGVGADTFEFETGGGSDKIKDWEDGTDVVDISTFGFSGIADVQAIANQYSNGVRLEFAGGEQLLFEGINASALSADDFIFS